MWREEGRVFMTAAGADTSIDFGGFPTALPASIMWHSSSSSSSYEDPTQVTLNSHNVTFVILTVCSTHSITLNKVNATKFTLFLQYITMVTQSIIIIGYQ